MFKVAGCRLFDPCLVVVGVEIFVEVFVYGCYILVVGVVDVFVAVLVDVCCCVEILTFEFTC